MFALEFLYVSMSFQRNKFRLQLNVQWPKIKIVVKSVSMNKDFRNRSAGSQSDRMLEIAF